MEAFDFFHELSNQKTYETLIPDKKTGLIITLLYEKGNRGELNDGFFSEDILLECIRQVEPTEERVPHEKYNQIVQNLQEYFIWRDEDNRRYKLKAYAIDFCKLVRDRLQSQFNPTYTEMVFKSLNKELNDIWKDVDTDPIDFNNWVSYHFTNAHTQIGSQVEILDKKLDESVKRLRQRIREENNNLLSVLKSVNEELGEIKSQVDELDSVFIVSETIREKLERLSLSEVMDKIEKGLSQVTEFLSQNTYKLRMIRKRIDKLRPRIQQLFGNLRKREFDLKTERFLVYLLEHSNVIRSKDIIELPKNVTLKTFHREELSLTLVRKKSFLPPRPALIPPPEIDVEKQKLQHLEREKSLQKQKQVQMWLLEVHETLEQHNTVDFSPFFYKMLDAGEELATAIEVAYFVLQKYLYDTHCQVIIGQQPIWRAEYPTHTLCEITIRKQPEFMNFS
jgi:hypothetical protein